MNLLAETKPREDPKPKPSFGEEKNHQAYLHLSRSAKNSDGYLLKISSNSSGQGLVAPDAAIGHSISYHSSLNSLWFEGIHI
jgi:hypothetical protein